VVQGHGENTNRKQGETDSKNGAWLAGGAQARIPFLLTSDWASSDWASDWASQTEGLGTI
jgi:hypothetical protein